MCRDVAVKENYLFLDRGFNSQRQMFTWMVCEPLCGLLQNLFRRCPLNSATKTPGPDGCWVCSCFCLNKAWISGCFVLHFSVLNVLKKLRLERERERHSSWTRMEGTHVESSSPRNKHFRWLEMDFSTTSVPWMLQRVHARPAGTNWVLRLELSLSFQALLQGCNFKCFRAKGRLAQE